ncbi:MAG: hypothetical protein J6M20_08975 [Clostridia bacterium]|nr:hypothetical protein [Clostridia bacterium]
MTTTMTVNTAAKTIEMTKTFATKAARFGSDEYKMLQEARRDYPDYKVETVARKNSKSKQEEKPSYKGLTYEYMEKYIAVHDDDDQTIMQEYLELRGMSEEADEALAESFSYQEMKNWFLDKFPAIADFHKKRAALLEKTHKKPTKSEAAREKMVARRTALLNKKIA